MTTVMEPEDKIDRERFEKPDEPIFEVGSLGDGLVLKNRRAAELTIEFAETFLEMPTFEGDRPVQENHVIFLARQMDGGTFRWEQVNFITCVLEGREYRMNGQHTSWARLHADEKQIKLYYKARTPIQVLKYEAKSEQDMRQLYATIDRGKSRNRGNVVVSYCAGREEFPDITKSNLRKIASGISFWRWDNWQVRKLHTPDEISYLMLTDYHKVSLQVANFMKLWGTEWPTAEIKHLMRQPVYGALLATFHKAPQIAEAFWRVVANGVGIQDRQDPMLQLRNYLMTSTLSLTGTDGNIRKVDTETMYRGCIHAWNLHREGKTVKNLHPAKLENRPAVK